MIARQAQTVERVGNMHGSVATMKIADGAEAKLMAILTDLYDDAQLAVIREYSTNAWDSHIEAGCTDRPIEVRLPQGFNTNLEIQDFGVGMDVDTIHNVYSQYGMSTKDQSNDQAGCFGLGCKAALTYTDQFIVTSNKDGVRVSVVVSRDQDGRGSMTIVDTRSTDEPNGTTISIPVGSHHQLPAKAAKFFAYWPEGTVLVDGKKPVRFEGLRLTDNLYVAKNQGYKPDHYVVMGNVPYPVPEDRIDVNLPYGNSLVAYVPMGSCGIPASREGLLLDDSSTIATFKQIENDFDRESRLAVQREISKARDHAQAIQIATMWHNVLNRGSVWNYSYKNTRIPDKLPGRYTVAPDRIFGKMSQASEYPNGLPIQTVPDALFITGWDYVRWSTPMRRKLNRYLDDNGLMGYTNYVLCTSSPGKPWVKDSYTVKWEDIRKIKLEQTRTNSGRIPGSYDLMTQDDLYLRTGIPGSDIDTSNPVFYTDKKWEASSYVTALRELHDKFTVVYLPSTRQAKFKRNVPHVKHVRTELKAAADKWAKSLPLDTRKAWTAMAQNGVSTLLYAEIEKAEVRAGKKINDPRVSEFGRFMQIDLTSVSNKARLFRNLVPGWSFHETSVGEDPLDDYPLMTHQQLRTAPGHVIDYMNWHYKTTIEKGD